VSAETAIKSAIRDARKAIKGVRLIEAGPDLVNLSDIAGIANFSRQNIQKYAAGKIRNVSVPFVPPVVTGAPSLYRLFEVCEWLKKHARFQLDDQICDISLATALIKLKLQSDRMSN